MKSFQDVVDQYADPHHSGKTRPVEVTLKAITETELHLNFKVNVPVEMSLDDVEELNREFHELTDGGDFTESGEGGWVIHSPQIEEVEEFFFIELRIRSGEYEKHNRFLIGAPDEAKAELWALLLECHSNWDELDIDNAIENGEIEDLNGEFIYQISSTKPVPFADIEQMSKYWNVFHYDEEQLNEARGLDEREVKLSVKHGQPCPVCGNDIGTNFTVCADMTVVCSDKCGEANDTTSD